MFETPANDLSKVLDAKLLVEQSQDILTNKAQLAIEEANKVWDSKGWMNTDVDRMLNTKMRSSRVSKA